MHIDSTLKDTLWKFVTEPKHILPIILYRHLASYSHACQNDDGDDVSCLTSNQRLSVHVQCTFVHTNIRLTYNVIMSGGVNVSKKAKILYSGKDFYGVVTLESDKGADRKRTPSATDG